MAAGPALWHILSAATHPRWQAFGCGAPMTALVQSSSAVTVVTIGVLNAGLLGLAHLDQRQPHGGIGREVRPSGPPATAQPSPSADRRG